MDPNAVPHEALAQRQRVFQTGVFICLMLLLMDPRDPRREQEAAVARARAEAEAAALRRQRAPTWLDGAVGGGAAAAERDGLVPRVVELRQRDGAGGQPGGPPRRRHGPRRRADGHVPPRGARVDIAVHALVSLSAPPGGARGRRDIFASAFGVYFHGARTAALLGNVGEPTEAGVDLSGGSVGRNATLAPRRREATAAGRAGGAATAPAQGRRAAPRRPARRPARRRQRARRRRGGGDHRRLAARLRRDHPRLADAVDDDTLAAALDNLRRRLGDRARTVVSSRPLPDAFFAGDRAYDLVLARESTKKDAEAKDPSASTVVSRADALPPRTPLRLPPDAAFAYPSSPFTSTLWRDGKCALHVDLVASDDKAAKRAIRHYRKSTPFVTTLAGVVRSPGCGFRLDVEATATRVAWDAARSQGAWYSTLMTAVCLAQIFALFKQVHFCRTQTVAARVSLLSVSMQALLDAVLCVANLLLCAAVNALFASSATRSSTRASPVCDAYLYGMAASRLLLPLYCLCDPDGLPRVLVVPSPGAPTYGARAAFALVLVAWQGVQVGLLKLQQHYGARCFVPAALIPKPYDYRRPIAHLVKGDDANLECPICMGDVACDGAHHLVTPCDHVFHDVCLGQWMDLKTECPVCRAQLPPVDAGDDGGGAGGDSPPNPNR
ncbi:RING finger ubiquitin ligase [Aureococcus anophagefferens]|nr:RING finger ubiquitin ligase [Aureococcus anophagefferens]